MSLPDRATIQADLLKFWVPCGCENGERLAGSSGFRIIMKRCVKCDGTGRQYPFRAECPYNTGYKHPGGFVFTSEYYQQREHDWSMDPPDSPWIKWPGPSCPCKGLNGGHIYVATLDTFCAAFRAKGWRVRTTDNPLCEGTFVLIELWPSSNTVQVVTADGLTGMAALEAATWRALPTIMEVK